MSSGSVWSALLWLRLLTLRKKGQKWGCVRYGMMASARPEFTEGIQLRAGRASLPMRFSTLVRQGRRWMRCYLAKSRRGVGPRAWTGMTGSG